MIITSCPLRISLVGGSTDHPYFLEKYGTGSVISFPSTLRVYTTLHQDVLREIRDAIKELKEEVKKNGLERTNSK